ncbi:MAG: GntR family transcriptional regulator [Actinobacteria bacterium]|nr:GntR family transcriptional regulator [Actinomycetota bacterium]
MLQDFINKDSGIPYYIQLKNILINKIDNNGFKDGKLWSQNEIALKYGITVSTVRKCLSELKYEGKIYKSKGVGTFVSKPKLTLNILKFLSLGKVIEDKGLEQKIIVLSKNIIKYDKKLFFEFEIENPSKEILQIKRLRKIDGEIIAYENILLNNDLCAPLFNDSDCKIINDYYTNNLKINLGKIEEYLEPISLNLYESKILEGKKGSASFLITAITHDINRTWLEFSRVIIKGGKCKFNLRDKF